MTIFSSITAALTSKKAPDAKRLAELIGQAETAVAEANTRLAELESQRDDKVLSGDKERLEYRAALTTTRDDIADGDAVLNALRGRHTAAVEAEAAAGRKASYDVAKAASDRLAGLIATYEKQAESVRDTVCAIAEIDDAVRAVWHDLPTGAAPLSESVTLRSTPAAPEEIVSEQVVELWCTVASSDPLGPDYQGKVSAELDGSGYLSAPSGSVRCVKRRFLRREFRKADSVIHAEGLDRVYLPAAHAPGRKERPVVVEHRLAG